MEAFLKTGKQIFNNKEIEVSGLFCYSVFPNYLEYYHEIKINNKFAGIIVATKTENKFSYIYSESQYQEYFSKEKNWARKIYKNPEDILYNLTGRK